ncbi:MAG: pentapeptide repeat-containing protein [Oscillatoria sp. SIO1A7]|nr:pentapeptide repeat-containing protein [Oscillatoria sp. SIO1A7]
MTAKEILQLYAEGRRNFRDISVRGQSFKGKNLSGADFNGADIRGANFTNACLRGAKFVGAKAGLQRRSAVGLVISSWLLSGVSGLMSLWIAYLISLISSGPIENIIAGWVALAVLAVFCAVAMKKGTLTAFGALAGAGVLAVAGAGYVALAGAVAGAVAVALAGALAGAGAGALAGAGTLALAGTGTLALAGAGTLALAVAVALAGALAGALALPGTGTGALAGAVAVSFIFTLFFLYISWRAMKGDPRDAWIRSAAVAFAAIGGTSFRGADLTDADFSDATLKSTDLRRANLTRTRWKNTIKLDFARLGNSYLDNPLIRELVRTGEGQDIDCDRLNLQGANLQGANLQGASFIEANLNQANLQDADLTDARLVHAQLDGADLTGATLTGAYIEEWNLTATTELKGIRCEWIFMRLPPEKRPAFIALPPEESRDQNPHRKPEDWKKNFEDGEFADFIGTVRLTLDLFHNQPVDPRLVALAFEQLKDGNPEVELEIVSIEKKGKNKDKLLVKAETSPQANHAEMHSQYFTNLEYLKSLSPEAKTAVLVDRGVIMAKLLDTKQGSPSISIENSSSADNTQVQGDNTTSEGDMTVNERGSVRTGDVTGGIVAGGDVSGGVAGQGAAGGDISGTVSVAINQLPDSPEADKPGIKELLAQLEEAIVREAALEEYDREDAMEELKKLAEAGKNPRDGGMKKMAEKAMRSLSRIFAGFAGLPALAKLAETGKEVLPALAEFFDS